MWEKEGSDKVVETATGMAGRVTDSSKAAKGAPLQSCWRAAAIGAHQTGQGGQELHSVVLSDGQRWHFNYSTTVGDCKHFETAVILGAGIICAGEKCCLREEEIKNQAGRPLSVVASGHAVADAWFGKDVGGIGCVVAQFLAESFDCGSKWPQVEGTGQAPDMLHEMVVGQGSAGAGGEVGEQPVFQRFQADGTAGEGNGVFGVVDSEIFEQVGGRGREDILVAQGGPNPGQEFSLREWLDDVVGGAQVKGPGDYVFLAVGGEENDGHVCDVENLVHQIDATASGQHEVEQDQVRLSFPDEAQGFDGVGSYDGIEAGF